MAKFGEMFKSTEIKKPEPHPQRVTKWIHYTKLIDNKAQYCNERDKDEIIALAELIEADKGILQNVLIRKVDTDEYEIIAGHKRRRAARYLVEERGLQEYAFIPCTIENLSEVRAEFQLYSSNSHHDKTDYEKMHELERMKYLLENYPEEFPHLQTGRMVERLAKQMHMSRTTVGEYLSISNNLGEKAREAFREGNIKKSAAVEMSSLSEKEQEKLIDDGVTAQKAIKAYKEKAASVPDLKEEQNVCRKEEENLPGQLKVANTDMEIEEEQPTEEEKTEAEEEEYTPEYFLEEQKEKLNHILDAQKQGEVMPPKVVQRQKIIVAALASMVSELEIAEMKKKTKRLMKPEK